MTMTPSPDTARQRRNERLWRGVDVWRVDPYCDPFAPRPNTRRTSELSYAATLILREADPSHSHPTGDVRDRKTGALRASADPFVQASQRPYVDPSPSFTGEYLKLWREPYMVEETDPETGETTRKPRPRRQHRTASLRRVPSKDSTLWVPTFGAEALNDPDRIDMVADYVLLGAVPTWAHLTMMASTVVGRGRRLLGADPLYRSTTSTRTRRSEGARASRSTNVKRGRRPVGPWKLAERSVDRAWSKYTAEDVDQRARNAATLIDLALRTAEHGTAVSYGAYLVMVDHDRASVIDPTTGDTYGIRSWARRVVMSEGPDILASTSTHTYDPTRGAVSTITDAR